VTPRVAATTRESRQRSVWAVARRIDELLLETATTVPGEFVLTTPGELNPTSTPGELAGLEAE
jgi:hypothetical protein